MLNIMLMGMGVVLVMVPFGVLLVKGVLWATGRLGAPWKVYGYHSKTIESLQGQVGYSFPGQTPLYERVRVLENKLHTLETATNKKKK